MKRYAFGYTASGQVVHVIEWTSGVGWRGLCGCNPATFPLDNTGDGPVCAKCSRRAESITLAQFLGLDRRPSLKCGLWDTCSEAERGCIPVQNPDGSTSCPGYHPTSENQP